MFEKPEKKRGKKNQKTAALNKIKSHGSDRFKSKMHDRTVISVKSPKCSLSVKELQCYQAATPPQLSSLMSTRRSAVLNLLLGANCREQVDS